MDKHERYLSAAEAAKALGVSKRALQFYEEKGLVKPVRTESGWRAYGAEALSRLHQILALKRMGLELAAIARLLQGTLAGLDSVLALQEQNLAARQSETQQALDLVRRARARLSSGEALSVDDLTTLTRETTMSVQTYREMLVKARRVLAPYMQKYFTPEQIKLIRSHSDSIAYIEAWIDALACLQSAVKTGDASSAAALDAARKNRIVEARLFGGDPNLAARYHRMWEEVVTNPAHASDVAEMHAMGGPTPEQMAFLGLATKVLEAKEAAAARRSA